MNDRSPPLAAATESLLRRSLPRQFAVWGARYSIDGGHEEAWRDCQVLDISSAGAGLELVQAPPELHEGSRLLVTVYLCGEIRHLGPTGAGLRVGIQFVDLSESQQSHLASLRDLGVNW